MKIWYYHENQIFILHVGQKRLNLVNKGQPIRSNKTNARIILLFCLCYGKKHHERNISSTDTIKQLQIHKLMVWIPKKLLRNAQKQSNKANKGQLMRSNKTNTRIFLPFLLCNGVYDMKGIFKPLTHWSNFNYTN